MGPERAGDRPLPGQPIARRSLLKGVGAGAVVAGAGGVLTACSSGIKGANSGGSTKNITIGWIHPLTGPLAGFGAPDNWVISKIKQTTPYKNGFKISGKTYAVTIKSYDSQSSPTRAGDLAKTAILNDGVDLLLASSTPETVNTVASFGLKPCCADCFHMVAKSGGSGTLVNQSAPEFLNWVIIDV